MLNGSQAAHHRDSAWPAVELDPQFARELQLLDAQVCDTRNIFCSRYT